MFRKSRKSKNTTENEASHRFLKIETGLPQEEKGGNMKGKDVDEGGERERNKDEGEIEAKSQQSQQTQEVLFSVGAKVPADSTNKNIPAKPKSGFFSFSRLFKKSSESVKLMEEAKNSNSIGSKRKSIWQRSKSIIRSSRNGPTTFITSTSSDFDIKIRGSGSAAQLEKETRFYCEFENDIDLMALLGNIFAENQVAYAALLSLTRNVMKTEIEVAVLDDGEVDESKLLSCCSLLFEEEVEAPANVHFSDNPKLDSPLLSSSSKHENESESEGEFEIKIEIENENVSDYSDITDDGVYSLDEMAEMFGTLNIIDEHANPEILPNGSLRFVYETESGSLDSVVFENWKRNEIDVNVNDNFKDTKTNLKDNPELSLAERPRSFSLSEMTPRQEERERRRTLGDNVSKIVAIFENVKSSL